VSDCVSCGRFAHLKSRVMLGVRNCRKHAAPQLARV
jgi:hypothetical protein